MEECYGLLGEGAARICGNIVEIRREGGGCLYRRGGVEALLSSCRLYVYPAAPVLYPERLTGYVMLVLDKPLVLPAGGEARLCLAGSHDVAVSAGSEGGVVDAFTTGQAKYALYGPPSRGVLARWVPVQRLAGCSDPPGCMMAVEVLVRNISPSPAAVRRIVYPAAGLPLAYSGCRVLGPRLVVTVQSRVSARVYAEPPLPPPGWRLAPTPTPRHSGPVAPLPLASGGRLAYTMSHGL